MALSLCNSQAVSYSVNFAHHHLVAPKSGDTTQDIGAKQAAGIRNSVDLLQRQIRSKGAAHLRRSLTKWITRQRISSIDEYNQSRLLAVMPEILSVMEVSKAQRDEIIQARKILRNKVLIIREERQEVAGELKKVRYLASHS